MKIKVIAVNISSCYSEIYRKIATQRRSDVAPLPDSVDLKQIMQKLFFFNGTEKG